jgi:putative ABC transport system ATP-binding protein
MRIELQDVRKSHMLPNGGFVTLLAGIDLTLESGSSTILSGASGSGKTTLLNIMAGLTRPTSGSVRLDGTVLPHGCDNHCGTISLAFQEPVFIPELTVLENLLLPAVRCKQSDLGRGEKVLELFGLSEQFDLMPANLSWGEKRRLNLARALFATPRLLLLDEPFAGLDREWEEKTMELIVRQVRDTQATLVIATANQVLGGDGLRRVRMQKGKVITDDNNDY